MDYNDHLCIRKFSIRIDYYPWKPGAGVTFIKKFGTINVKNVKQHRSPLLNTRCSLQIFSDETTKKNGAKTKFYRDAVELLSA